jgi:EAL domain-containing protein (putative c-di-GMP-specific phosphodiesterase class I)
MGGTAMSPLARDHPSGPEITDWPELLRTAIDGDGLRTVYQPIVDLTRGLVAGYEALTRFVGYPIRNPEPWFAAAHTHGRSADLQATALRTALSERTGMPRGCFLTVNVSPDVLTHPAIQRVWADQDTLHGLVIELTEPFAAGTRSDVEADLDHLRAAGALIAVSYTGTGYADLAGLATLRPTMIKLDRSLIHDVDHDEAKRALLDLARTFAGRIDAWLLAQGIENPRELATLTALRIPLAQGYHLGRPARPWAPVADQARHQLKPPLDQDHPVGAPGERVTVPGER